MNETTLGTGWFIIGGTMKYLVCVLGLILLLNSNVFASNKKTYFFTDNIEFSVTINMSEGYDLKDLSDARIEIIKLVGGYFIPIEGPVTRLVPLSPTSNSFYEKYIPEALWLLKSERDSTKIFLENCTNYASKANKDPEKLCYFDGIKSLGEEGVRYSYEKLDEINETLLSTPEVFISLSELIVSDDLKFVSVEVKLAEYSMQSQQTALYYNNKLVEGFDAGSWKMAAYKGSSGTDYLIQWGYTGCGQALSIHKVTPQGLELISKIGMNGPAC